MVNTEGFKYERKMWFSNLLAFHIERALIDNADHYIDILSRYWP